jgi:two-component system, NarL family, nitrate/nitrite response regulator NarL
MKHDATGLIRIILVHDHALLREAIRVLINANPDMRVVGEASHCAEAVLLANTVKPDLVVINLPRNHEQLLEVIPSLTSSISPRVLILAEQSDSETTRLAIRLGASGVVNKDESGQMLTKALRRVHTGELWLNRSMTAAVFQDMRHGTSSPAQSLSRREQEIVALVAQGLGTRKLAECLHISDKTVRNHLSSIYEKLGISDRVELALFAIQQGLTRVEPGTATLRKA